MVNETNTDNESLNDRTRFVGTYELVKTEVMDPITGKWSLTPNFNSNGYITYTDTGYVGIHIMPKIRPKFKANIPTGEEAQAALNGYTACFGLYNVNEEAKEKFVTHNLIGQINPGGAVKVMLFYEFATLPNSNQWLILTPTQNDGGIKEEAARRFVWQRMPEAPLTAEAKRFIGFYKLLYTYSYRMKEGKEVFRSDRNETRAGTSCIIYTSSGHMMVHLMDNSVRRKYAGAEPSPDEALEAFKGYGGYFGRFITYENYDPPFVYHCQLGSLNPGVYRELKRFYQFTGNVLRLGGLNINEAGELVGGHLYWERTHA